jgi:hypothetical protein
LKRLAEDSPLNADSSNGRLNDLARTRKPHRPIRSRQVPPNTRRIYRKAAREHLMGDEVGGGRHRGVASTTGPC